ncbi:MAG: hypothetical protein HYY46_00610 [Deltaproteobacteria bacterium]|nr:hypothetical protein [Deltaproteobacteria bacterium]
MSEIPKPTDTGSSGTQIVGVHRAIEPQMESPLEGLPIARTVEGLAASQAKKMGGEVVAGLLAGSFSQLSANLEDTKRELRSVREELRETQGKLSDYQIKSAVLKDRVDTLVGSRHLKNLSIAIGTVLIGFGIELFRSNLENVAVIPGALGTLLLLLGWFSKNKGTET